MKKLFLLLFASVLVLSCTKDVELTDSTADLSTTISQYDATNLGVYKGVFTTQGTLERGVVEINVIPGNYATATIQLVSGQTITYRSNQVIEEGMEINELKMVATGFGETSFLFSTDLHGTNVIISRVMYNGKKAGMIAAHDTSLAPVVPITGVLACDDCDAHPLMVTGDTGTFSLLYVGDGSADDSITALSDVGLIVSTPGAQSGCVDGGSQTTCDVAGGGTIGTNLIGWLGSHIYDNAGTCSEAAGTWSLDSGNHGSFTGTFTSDTSCGGLAGDFPATAIPITLGAEGDGCAIETHTALLATNGHTDSGNISTCNNGAVDIFYSWTATTDGLTFTGLNPSSTITPGVSVLDAGLVEIACGDGSFGAIVLSGLTIGTDYFIRISAAIDIPFCIEEFTVPAIPTNDLCGDAEAISCGDSIAGNTVTATNSDGDRGNDVWYSLDGTTTTAGDNINLSLCASVYDTYLLVQDACGGATVASNDDSCGGQSNLDFISDGATNYIIRVDGFSAGDSGAFTLDVTCGPAPLVEDDNNRQTEVIHPAKLAAMKK